MPRKKRMPGAHFEWDFVNGPRGRSMTAVEWTFYSKMWALATHERRKIVCRMRYDCTYLADFMHIDRRTLRKLMTDLEHGCYKNARLGELVEVTDHYIKVNGVQEKQDWLTWKDTLPCCSLHVPSRSTNTIDVQTSTIDDTSMSPNVPVEEDQASDLLNAWPQIQADAGLPMDAIPDVAKSAKLSGEDWLPAFKDTIRWALEKYGGYDALHARLLELVKGHAAGNGRIYSLKSLLTDAEAMTPPRSVVQEMLDKLENQHDGP